MKVVGATTPYSGTASNVTVRIPTNLKATVTESTADVINNKIISELNDVAISSGKFNIKLDSASSDTTITGLKVADLNNVSIGSGSFKVTVNDTDGTPQSFTFTVDSQAEVGTMLASWNKQIEDYNTAAQNATPAQATIDKLKFSVSNGKIQIETTEDLTFETLSTNFLTETGLSSTNLVSKTLDTTGTPQILNFSVDATDTMGDNVLAWNRTVESYNATNAGDVDLSFEITADGKLKINSSETLEFEPIDTNIFAETKLSPVNLTSKTLNYSAVIQDLLDYNDADGIAVSSVTIIDENGILSYSDGSNLTTQINELNQAEWRYTTPDGTIITGSDITPKGSINVNSNMIIELASFVNETGLVSINNNLWEWGPDAGEVFYGMAGEMAFGSLESGGYEGSNVDIAVELSNMITAQRMIQMNSRVFGTASSVMETLAYLGQ